MNDKGACQGHFEVQRESSWEFVRQVVTPS